MSPQAPMNGTILRSASLTDHSSSDESYESCEEVNRHYSRFIDANFYKCLESPGQNKELKPSDENWGYPGYLSSSQLSSLVRRLQFQHGYCILLRFYLYKQKILFFYLF